MNTLLAERGGQAVVNPLLTESGVNDVALGGPATLGKNRLADLDPFDEQTVAALGGVGLAAEQAAQQNVIFNSAI